MLAESNGSEYASSRFQVASVFTPHRHSGDKAAVSRIVDSRLTCVSVAINGFRQRPALDLSGLAVQLTDLLNVISLFCEVLRRKFLVPRRIFGVKPQAVVGIGASPGAFFTPLLANQAHAFRKIEREEFVRVNPCPSRCDGRLYGAVVRTARS